MDNIQKFPYNHSKSATEKKTIMICEDEPDVLLSFELLLESKYNIIMVDSGQKCVEKYIAEISRGNKIHLVLLDYKLRGGVMGDSVARKIKEYSETKVILISAYNIDDELVKELKNGSYITKYVLKPIDSERLTNLIDDIIKN
jgi:CheY-like chemotaxis protein